MKIAAYICCLVLAGQTALAETEIKAPDPAGVFSADPVEKLAALPALPEAEQISALAVPSSLRPKARKAIKVPKARWDNIPGSRSWSLAILSALRAHADELPDLVPKDIANYCPAYPTASRAQREAFWVGLTSALAWHESTHRPTAVGGGGRWYGLVQIYPPTARFYKCKAKSGSALTDPEDNLSCAMRIMAVTVPRDNVISRGMRGVAADWGPFHSRRKREDIMNWTREQSYCKGMSSSLRPIARPEVFGPDSILPQSRPQLDAGDPVTFPKTEG
ncbi:transglycosylase SLT domain-containing protein [Antarctobacter jejuensis]|uniref:transglycosylase SLT domain-containing protein n=1 Tax=Antarctobacter jejuensis TaxID=1439938 RepID=UPI003FD06A16